MAKRVDKECECCGKMMYGVTMRRSRCDECTRLHGIEVTALYKEKSKHVAAVSQSAAKLERDAFEADQMGLSYGYWRLRMMGVI